MGRPRKPEGTRIRDVAPTGVRLAPDLRDALIRLAAISGRTLSGEMQYRLRESVERHLRETQGAVKAAVLHAAEEPLRYTDAAPLLSESQRMVLAMFDRLAPDKQLALLTLLRA